MQEMQYFLNYVVAAKNILKEAYYTTQNEETKADTKQLIAALIGIEKTVEELLEMYAKHRLAAKLLKDRKAQLELRKWSVGLDRRAKDYVKRSTKLGQEHLHRYHETLRSYIDGIGLELAGWIVDLQTLDETPRPPSE